MSSDDDFEDDDDDDDVFNLRGARQSAVVNPGLDIHHDVRMKKKTYFHFAFVTSYTTSVGAIQSC